MEVPAPVNAQKIEFPDSSCTPIGFGFVVMFVWSSTGALGTNFLLDIYHGGEALQVLRAQGVVSGNP